MIMTDVVVVFIKGALHLITNRYSSSTKKVEVVRKIRKCATLHGVSRPLGVEYLKALCNAKLWQVFLNEINLHTCSKNINNKNIDKNV